MTEAVEGAKVGRPSKYDPAFCDQMIEFFDREPTEKRFESQTEDEDKGTKTVYKGGGVDFPTFTEFSQKLGVCDKTLEEWAKVHPEFSLATEKCKKLQEKIWMINALNGNYSAAFSIFLGKNVFGYKDKQEIEANQTVVMMPTIKIDGEELLFDVGGDDEPKKIGQDDE